MNSARLRSLEVSAGIQIEHACQASSVERWPSGRRQRFAKPSQGQKPCRGFKSRPLRQPWRDRSRRFISQQAMARQSTSGSWRSSTGNGVAARQAFGWDLSEGVAGERLPRVGRHEGAWPPQWEHSQRVRLQMSALSASLGATEAAGLSPTGSGAPEYQRVVAVQHQKRCRCATTI